MGKPKQPLLLSGEENAAAAALGGRNWAGCRGEEKTQPVAAARRPAAVVLEGCRWTVRERGVREREKRKEGMGEGGRWTA